MLQLFWAEIPFKTIWGLVWPQTVSMLCILIIGLTDMWVGGKINSDIQASIGVSAQLQAFFMVIGMALGSAVMAAVTQSLGAKRKKRAQRYAGLTLLLSLGFAIILGILGFLFRDVILSLLHVPEAIYDTTMFFFLFVLVGLPVQYIMNIGAILFRAAKDMISPLLIVIVVASINVFGDLAFGLGYFGMPNLGGHGIAISTFSAVSVGAVLTFFGLKRKNMFIKRILPESCWIKVAAPYIVRVATPAVINQTLWQIGYLILFSIVAFLPNSVSALAGMTAGMRLESILFMPGVAFHVTASIMVGNALGEGNKQQAKRIGLVNIFLGVTIMSTVAFCMWPFVSFLANIFSSDLLVQATIISYLTINIICTPFTLTSMILSGIMTGAGATIYPMIINTICVWAVRLPCAWFLGHTLGYGPSGVFLAMLISMAIQSIALFCVFLFRDWTVHSMRAKHLR